MLLVHFETFTTSADDSVSIPLKYPQNTKMHQSISFVACASMHYVFELKRASHGITSNRQKNLNTHIRYYFLGS